MSRHDPFPLLLAVLVTVMSAACSDPPRDTSASFHRDSMGVAIVENTGPIWDDGEEWSVALEPSIEIGVVDGDPHYQLDDVVAARVLDDGAILVANSGSSEIRRYDSTGVFQTAWGGSGKGPGEFQDLDNIALTPNGGLLAFDSDLDRVTVFDRGGQVLRTFPVRRPGAASLGFISPAPDGSLVFRLGWASMGFTAGGDGLYRNVSPILRYHADTAVMDTIGVSPGLEIRVSHNASGQVRFGPPLLGRSQSITVFGDRIYWGSQDDFEIGAYTPDGTLQMLIRIPDVDLAISERDVEEVKAGLLAEAADMPDPEGEVEKYLQNNPLPDVKPAYGRMVADSLGFLWVSDATWSGDEAASWKVFDPDGNWLGTVRMPERFHVLEIGRDYILGRFRDQFDVEYVRLYGLSR